jgi:hypothetical protein
LFYYFASQENFDNKVLEPRVPEHKYNCEDAEVKRICVSQSINGCITALASSFSIGDIVYIHQCESDNVIQPTTKQVVDVCFTGEQWVLEPVVMKLFMKIIIIGMIDATINDMSNVLYAFKLTEY